MKLHSIDIAIMVGYFLVVVLMGLWVSRRGAKNLDSYFLGNKSIGAVRSHSRPLASRGWMEK